MLRTPLLLGARRLVLFTVLRDCRLRLGSIIIIIIVIIVIIIISSSSSSSSWSSSWSSRNGLVHRSSWRGLLLRRR